MKRNFKLPLPCRQHSRGLTMVELIASISVIGIVGSVAMSVYSGVSERASAGVASNLVSLLNDGVKKYEQINWQITLAADNGSGDDEQAILESLQYRDPVNPVPGSPFVRPDWLPVSSTDTDDFRLIWNGRVFYLAEPGTTGGGLKVNFGAADIESPRTYESDFTLIGG